MIVLMMGAPGAGKGTQAQLLVEKFGWETLSTGDALRRQIAAGTKVGRDAARFMDEGKLVPDDVLLGILGEEIGGRSTGVVLLDGYPRNLVQAEALAELPWAKVGAVVHLDVAQSELERRISGRLMCPGCSSAYHSEDLMPQTAGKCDGCGDTLVRRPDDEPEKVQVRLDIYSAATEPVLKFYREQGLYRQVEGRGGIEEIFERVCEALGDLRVKGSVGA